MFTVVCEPGAGNCQFFTSRPMHVATGSSPVATVFDTLPFGATVTAT